MTPEARVTGRCQLLVQGQFVRERSISETAEELKSLGFSVQPSYILLPHLKINLMVSFSYVKKICYLHVPLVQTVLYWAVMKDRTQELSLTPSVVVKGCLLLCLLQLEEMC